MSGSFVPAGSQLRAVNGSGEWLLFRKIDGAAGFGVTNEPINTSRSRFDQVHS